MASHINGKVSNSTDLSETLHIYVNNKKKTILFVGTKHQVSTLIAQEAQRCESFYVNHRWLGGMLTNWSTLTERIAYLKDLENSIASDPWVTIHPRRYMAGPHRIAYKNSQRLKKEYYKSFFINGLLSITMSFPLIL